MNNNNLYKEQEMSTQRGETASANEELVQEESIVEKSEIGILQEQLLSKTEEAQKYYDQYLRSLAEAENIRKRSQRDKEEYLKFAHLSIIKKLLPIIDDLNRGLEAASVSQDFAGLKKGLEITARNLADLLSQEGVQAIDCVGKPFDPQYHEPLMVVSSDEHPENTVIEELNKGYIMHDRLIRPSLVKVSGK
jgi:molecular chaperone GrpE